ncbi:hypothetical protein [Breznakiella homolactica]|uniref:Uncharacterized protein n=1 Tax=Breznakiella homolactica TaxID=2798577 RepID=A0A7T8B9K2_9SPIR|nr:hypothetical protein [Breznakiella homolactica]QQO08552.1 hypothetical protein JFL75_16685 [Breznakiella homolactica]
MAKISNEERHQYLEKTKPYRETIDSIIAREKNILGVIQKDPNGAVFKKLTLAEDMLNLASHYIILSTVSQSMLKVKNEDALNDGRKALYKAIIYLEEIVTSYVDVPFADYEDKLEELESVDSARRYLLMRKTGLAIQLMENAYGDNTKWKWSFVDLEGRFAAVSKNIFDLKNAVVNMDPRSPNYESTVYHLRMIKKLLMQAADRYREKYELSTNRIDDFKLGISFLGALRRIHVILGDRDDAETVKKKYDIWSAKLEADIKKKIEQEKKA